ncbi:MAG TPA: pyridoxamine 5'-phosphate oxidase, partial [Cytophagaceae bacterium]|nr:pyridoxamine 5'-phosphate oxidase [Cytophagaceae bacterium]
MNISSIRKEYRLKQLRESDIQQDPLLQFHDWFHEAIHAQVNEPNAMNLSTVKASGRPSSRIVLLKGIEQDGFVFYTNYESDKGQQLQHSPFASLCFFWPELERQVRIEGKVIKGNATASDNYFSSRPFASQLGALASPQSQVIENRSLLEEKLEQLKKQYGDHVTRPDHWGGFVLIPDYMEFWQGR